MINKLSIMVAVLGVLVSLMAPQSRAQQPAAPAAVPEQPTTRQTDKVYRPHSVETLAGKVVNVYRPDYRVAELPHHMKIRLQTDKGEVRVRLGPVEYIDQRMKLAVGDRVEVKGHKVMVKGVLASGSSKTGFVASEVKKGNQVLKLRDDATGRSLWFKSRNPGGDI